MVLTLNVRLQSIQQMTAKVSCDRYQNQQLQHEQKPSLALSEAQFCVFPGLLKAEL